MFITLTTPKLLELDLPVLVELLSSLTLEYSHAAKSDGISCHPYVLKEYIMNIHSVIEMKKSMKRLPGTTQN